MHKKSEIISVKKVLILTADLSPKWWVGTSDRTGQNSLKLVHFLLKSGHDRKKITSEIMQCIRTIFVFETVNCFLDVFFKSPKLISILHIPQTIPLFQSNYILSSMDFFMSRPWANIRGGRGARKKTQVKGRTEKRKT